MPCLCKALITTGNEGYRPVSEGHVEAHPRAGIQRERDQDYAGKGILGGRLLRKLKKSKIANKNLINF